MFIGLHWERLEASLVEMTLSSRIAVRIPALLLSECLPTDKVRQVPVCAGPEKQMSLLRHKTIRQDAHVHPFHRFPQHALEARVIPVVSKTISRPLAHLRT